MCVTDAVSSAGADMSEVAREKYQPRPIEADLNFPGEGWQFEKIDAAPHEPGDEAGEVEAEQFCDGGMSADGAKFAKQFESERFGLLALHDADDILRALTAFTFGELAGGWGRLAILVIDNNCAITNRPGIGRAFHTQVWFSEQAAFFFRRLHAREDRRGRIADGANR